MSMFGWICVWPNATTTVDVIIDQIMAATCSLNVPQVTGYVRRMFQNRAGGVRANQRFDLFVPSGLTLPILSLLKLAHAPSGERIWHVKIHDAYMVRKSIVTRKRENRMAISAHGFCSQNLNGLDNKAVELSICAIEKQIDIILVQETNRDYTYWPCRMPGFNVFEQYAQGTGKRGVAVCVRKGIMASPIEPSCAYLQLTKIVLQGVVWIFGSVYLPTKKGAQRRKACRLMKLSIRGLLAKYSAYPIILSGDFNCSAEVLAVMLDKWGVGFYVCPIVGSAMTWHRGTKESGLDHVLCNNRGRQSIGQLSVDRTDDLSDHWPIVGSIMSYTEENIAMLNRKVPTPRIDPELVPALRSVIANHTLYAETEREVAELLANDNSNQTIDKVVELFHSTCFAVAESVGALKPVKVTARPSMGLHLPNGVLRLIKRKRTLQCDTRLALANADIINYGTLSTNLKQTTAAIRTAVRTANQVAWVKIVQKGTTEFVSQQSTAQKRRFWAWLSQIKPNCGVPSFGQVSPVVGPDGDLKLTPASIHDAWVAHYGGLASDKTGLSHDAQYWNDNLRDIETLSELPGLNEPLLWPEVRKLIGSLKRWKAAGPSGLITEWLQAVLAELDDGSDADHNEPATPMGRLLFAVVTVMWKGCYLAEPIRIASVVSVPKGGDATDMNNYRGISLIDALAKVVLSLRAQRMREALRASGRICRAQAGFCPTEEGVGQIITLWDLLERRLRAGLETWVTFLDFKKAFDCVPHECVLLKAYKIGIQGDAHKALVDLYSGSKFLVRSDCATVADVRPLEKGVRQGCPPSSDLFDIHINDLFVGVPGVTVPNVEGLSIPGLLFADDANLVADSAQGMQASLDVAGNWAAKHQMEYGMRKCATFLVSNRADASERLEGANLLLAGAQVPTCSSYKVLGLEIDSSLNLEFTVKARTESARRAVAANAAFLTDNFIPIGIKRAVILTKLQPVLAFGGELLGMRNETLLKPLQTCLNKALQFLAVGKSRIPRISPASVMCELGLPPVTACMAGLRARYWAKAPNSHTFIADLYEDSKPHKGSWIAGTERWLRGKGPSLGDLNVQLSSYLKANNMVQFQNHAEVPPKMLGRAVKRMVTERTWAKSHDVAWVFFAKYKLKRTNNYIARSVELRDTIKWARGFSLLLQARTGCLLTAKKAAAAKIVPAAFRRICPFCDNSPGETLEHLIFQCRAWSTERRFFLRDLIVKVNNCLPQGATRTEKLALLLGGSVGNCTLGQVWSVGVSSFKVPLTKKVYQTPLCFVVAKFLQSIEKTRCNKLSLASKTASVDVIDVDILLNTDDNIVADNRSTDGNSTLIEDDILLSAEVVEDDLLLGTFDNVIIGDDPLILDW